MSLFHDLQQRGLVKQITNADKIRTLLDDNKISFFIGFDPTADSLHVGHLLQVITAKRFALAGHRPLMLIGGATAAVGDPTGKTDARKMLSRADIDTNGTCFVAQIGKIMGGSVNFINNLSLFNGIEFLSFMREVGKHFSVNNMLRAECFKSRMEHGLSFLELSYMTMQAFDFHQLFVSKENCVLQVGGDDQWSNILAGIDLIHKKEAKEAFGLTLPLLVNSDGTKMGKTERGAVWLDQKKTSVTDFFQFWRNLPDIEVIKCFRQLTFLSLEEIEAIPFNKVEDINTAKKKLAHAITSIVHGGVAADAAFVAAEGIFKNHDPSAMKVMEVDDGLSILELLVRIEFAKSRTDARNLINGRGIVINDQVMDNPTMIVSARDFCAKIVVKKGKKNFCRVVIKTQEHT